MATQSHPVPMTGVAAPDSGGLRSWLSTVDHKRIGIMYLVLTLFFFLVGGLMASSCRPTRTTSSSPCTGRR